MDYWVSTKSNMELIRKNPVPPHVEAYLIANKGVDPYMLARDLKMITRQIMKWQRELGLRQLASNGHGPRYHLNNAGHHRNKK